MALLVRESGCLSVTLLGKLLTVHDVTATLVSSYRRFSPLTLLVQWQRIKSAASPGLKSGVNSWQSQAGGWTGEVCLSTGG